MCGIFGIIGSGPVAEIIVKSLSRLSYRGYDSWGITVPYQLSSLSMSKWVLGTYKQLGPIEDWDIQKVNAADPSIFKGRLGIGHTRWATHGTVSLDNTHPFLGCRQDIAVAHNGIIENWKELRKDLEQGGHRFRSDTDSEVLVHLLEESSGDLTEKLAETIKHLKGTYAIVACDRNGISVARKNQPLMLGAGGDYRVVGSDTLAFAGLAQKYIDVPECEALDVVTLNMNQHLLWYLNPSTEQDSSLQGHDHHMLKEILEQPESLKRAIDQNPDVINSTALDILSYNQVVLTGCGTSRNAALVGRYAFSSLRKKWSTVIVGSELPLLAASANNSFLVLAVSQSGETADITHHAQDLLNRGVYLASIVNVPQSQLDRMSHRTLYMNAGPEYGVAATKSFVNTLAVLYLLTGAMIGRYTEMKDRLAGIDLTSILDSRKYLADLATRLAEHNDVYFLARDSNYPVAGEAALKLKEVSYIHAEGMSAGELKHGTLALISKGTPVVGICPNDYTRQPMVDNLYEVKARGGWIIGISDKESDVFDEWIKVPAVPEVLYPLVSIVPVQLISYYAALARKLNPDRPRNLCKSVTVL